MCFCLTNLLGISSEKMGPKHKCPLEQSHMKHPPNAAAESYWIHHQQINDTELQNILLQWIQLAGIGLVTFVLSDPLSCDWRCYSCDTPYSVMPSRGQLELRCPVLLPPFGCNTANFGGWGTAQYPMISENKVRQGIVIPYSAIVGVERLGH